MANQDLLYAWWWSDKGPRIQSPVSINDLSNNLTTARNNLIIVGRDENRIKDSGWNYAVLKFLIEYCNLPSNLRNIFIEHSNPNNGRYSIWKDYLNNAVTVINPGKNINVIVNNLNAELDDEPKIRDEYDRENIEAVEVNQAFATINLVWKRFYSFSEAVEYSENEPTVYMQVSKAGLILRLGKAGMGLGNRYNGGYQRTLDAAMWESGNLIYITKAREISVEEIEVKLIEIIDPPLNRQKPPSNPNLVLNHGNIVIEDSRVVSYSHPISTF